MNKISEQVFEFSYKVPGYDFVSANAALYAFLGSRLYITADRLLTGGSISIIDKAFADKAFGKTLIVTIGDESGNDISMAAQLIKSDNDVICNGKLVRVRMIELDKLFNGFRDLVIKEKETNALLAQNNCVYYSYEKVSDTITSYRFDIGKNIIGVSNGDEWREKLAAVVSDNSAEAVSKLVSDLRNGVRSIECSFLHKQTGKNIVITGSAVYSDNEHIMTVGRIGDPNENASHELNNRDQLTGLFMKGSITNYTKRRIDDLRQPTAMAIIDIDDFKLVNDNFGHAKGDEVLKRCAAIIEKQVEGFGKAGRIGGDEFFIVFDNFEDKERLKFVLRGIKNMVYAAYNEGSDGFCVTTSIGVSVFPEDLDGNYDIMFKLADCLLYRAKQKGKNRYIIYDPAKHGDVEELLESGVKNASFIGGRAMEKSEVICKIANKIICGEEFELEQILNDVMNYFGIDRITIYNKTDRSVVMQCGKDLLSPELLEETIDYIYDKKVESAYDNGIMLISHTVYFDMKSSCAYDLLCKQGVLSVMHHEVKAKSGKTFIISYEMTVMGVTWNESDSQYFRILDKVLFEQYL